MPVEGTSSRAEGEKREKKAEKQRKVTALHGEEKKEI